MNVQAPEEGTDVRTYSGHDAGTGSEVNNQPNTNRQRPLGKVDIWVKRAVEDPKNRHAFSAFSKEDPASVLRMYNTAPQDEQVFTLEIPPEAILNSPLCSPGSGWLTAALGVFRVAVMRRYNLESFELSQAYYFFWDKVGKANCFLENVLATADKPLDDRLVSTLFTDPISEQGQWELIAGLIPKYGIVPRSEYPDSWIAKNPSIVLDLLSTQLRAGALRMRAVKNSKAIATAIQAAKEEIMEECVRILTVTLGPVPPVHDRFTWRFQNKDTEIKTLYLSPFEFGESLWDHDGIRACGGSNIQNLFSMVHDPRHNYHQILTVDRLGNMWHGKQTTHVNVEMGTMKNACVAMLRKGWPVFIGSDIRQFKDGVKSIVDTVLVDGELGSNERLGLTKEERLLTGESRPTQAGLLTAVHLDESGTPVKWRVQRVQGEPNSFVVTDRWMDEFCYQAVVDSSLVDDTVSALHKRGAKMLDPTADRHSKDALECKMKVLDSWDPLGALA